MKIRTQIVILLVAAITPVAIFAAVTTYNLWQAQRHSYEQRFLERVNALRLALDTELEGTIRTLRSLAESADFDPGAAALHAHAHFERLTRNRPEWITMGLTEADGDPAVQVSAAGVPEHVRLDPETMREVIEKRTPAISNLVTFDDARMLVTFVAVPVVRNDTFHGIVYTGVAHRGWLEFLQRYPIAERATLTLIDRTGRIVTRTLNDERWAGQPASPTFWARTADRSQDVFQSVGLDGQRFYSAFSRSQRSGWVLGTGVPREFVEEGLAASTVLLVLGVLTAGVLASVLAWVFGRRLADTVTALAERAKSMAAPAGTRPSTPLPIAEAETVRIALDEAAVALDARERSLNEALDREGRSRAAAEHANQAKDQFLAMLGHELRNPLSAISAAVAVLDMKPAEGDPDRRARDIVRRQLRHLTEIVNDLLDVSRLTSGKVALNPRPLDLSSVVRNAVASLEETGRSDHVTVTSALAAAPVIADETRLEQVVGNLLDNACKYTPAGGRVSVTTSVDGDDVQLLVADNGSGIGPELLPHVFDLFAQGQRTIDRAQGGLGLGLTVVRRLIEMHGGTVAVRSEGANRGSTFIVRLPRARAAIATGATTEPSPQLDERRIVVVEDNADIREVVSTLLRMKGHDVLVADNGPAGLAAIEAADAEIALVDIGLPGFDGTELARRARQRGRTTILVALTGYGAPEDRARALAAGFDAFLVKPFDLHAFEAAVDAAEAARGASVAS